MEPSRQDTGTPPILQIVLSVGIIQVLSMAFGLLRSKVVAVTVGPQGVGIVSLIDQVVNLVVQICTLSLPYAAIKFLSAAHSENRKAFADLYVAFLRVLLVISLLGTGIAITLVRLWPAALGGELAVYGNLMILGLLSIPATNLIGLLTNTMAAARRVHASAIYGSLLMVAWAICGGGGVLLDGLRGYYVGTLIGVCTLVVGGMLFLYRQEGLRIHSGRMGILQEIQRYPNVLSVAGALYLVSFTGPLADLIVRYAVLHSRGLGAAGLYQAAFGIALSLRTVIRSSFPVFLMPTVNRKTEPQEKFQTTIEFIRAVSIITGIMGLPLVLFPEVWLSLLYSPKFAAAAPYVYVFVCAIIVQLFGAAAQALMIGLDRIGTYALVAVVGDLAIGGLSWGLVPILGFNGAGIAFLINGVLLLSFTAWNLRSGYQLRIFKALGALPWFALACVAGGGALATILPSHSPHVIAAKASLGLTLAAVMLVSAGRDNRSLLRRFFRLHRTW